jgi:hypothetical protein
MLKFSTVLGCWEFPITSQNLKKNRFLIDVSCMKHNNILERKERGKKERKKTAFYYRGTALEKKKRVENTRRRETQNFFICVLGFLNLRVHRILPRERRRTP